MCNVKKSLGGGNGWQIKGLTPNQDMAFDLDWENGHIPIFVSSRNRSLFYDTTKIQCSFIHPRSKPSEEDRALLNEMTLRSEEERVMSDEDESSSLSSEQREKRIV